jgi:hypothetical protein
MEKCPLLFCGSIAFGVRSRVFCPCWRLGRPDSEDLANVVDEKSIGDYQIAGSSAQHSDEIIHRTFEINKTMLKAGIDYSLFRVARIGDVKRFLARASNDLS